MVQKIENKKKKQIVTLQYLMTSRKSATKTLIGKLRFASQTQMTGITPFDCSRLKCSVCVAGGIVCAGRKLSPLA